MKANRATPPITPPTMAPIGGEDLSVDFDFEEVSEEMAEVEVEVVDDPADWLNTGGCAYWVVVAVRVKFMVDASANTEVAKLR
jgi:hypothetical protein